MVQASHALAFCVVLKVPDAQPLQVRSAVVLPSTLTYVPGWQVLHALQLAALVVELYVPLVQALHARSVVAEPAVATAKPAAHCVHAMQLLAGFAS